MGSSGAGGAPEADDKLAEEEEEEEDDDDEEEEEDRAGVGFFLGGFLAVDARLCRQNCDMARRRRDREDLRDCSFAANEAPDGG